MFLILEPVASVLVYVLTPIRCHQILDMNTRHVEVLTYVAQSQQWHTECATCSECHTIINGEEAILDERQSKVYCQSCSPHNSNTHTTHNPTFSYSSIPGPLCLAVVSLFRHLVWLLSVPFLVCQSLYYDIFLGQILLYNISFEDARIDRQVLQVKDQVVLTLTSAGDNVFDALTEGAKKVIAVDQNIAQSSLMELKMAGIKYLHYDQFWSIFGECDGELFRSVYPTHLRSHLSVSAQQYWDNRQYYIDGFMYRGGSGTAAWLLVHVFFRVMGLKGMLDELMTADSLIEQREIYHRWRPYFHRILRTLYWCGAWKCFAWLVAVPTNQQALLSTNWEHYIEYCVDHLCLNTFLPHNHYYSVYILGHYTQQSHAPRYLQRAYFPFLKHNLHRIEVKCANLFQVMQDLASSGQQVDRFNLLDHMDWMDEQTVLQEWQYISRIAAPGAKAIWKSISEISSPNVLSVLSTSPENQQLIDAFMQEDYTPTYRCIRVVDVPTTKQMIFAPRVVPSIQNHTFLNDLHVLYAMYVLPVLRRMPWNEHEAFSSAAVSPIEDDDDHSNHSDDGDTGDDSVSSCTTLNPPTLSLSRTHMNAFYAPQAALYDSYRHRMLHGRRLMSQCLPVQKDGIWIDVGGGTGFNCEYLADVLHNFEQIYIVDVCDHLLAQANQRVAHNQWHNVQCIQHDVCSGSLLPITITKEDDTNTSNRTIGVDLITFSYSLSMIPDWEAALQAAYDSLRPGGIIALCDFTVLPSSFQSPLTRALLTHCFSIDGVNLREAHRQRLVELFIPCVNEVRFGGFPYVPLLACPYYVFVGKKPECAGKLVWRGSPVAKQMSLTKRTMSGLMLAEASLSA